MPPDVWAALGKVTVLNGPAFSGGGIAAAPGQGDLGGIRILPVPGLPAGQVLVGDSRAVRAYGGGSAGVRLSALVVGVAQTQHGLYSEFAINTENPAGWVKHNFTPPLAAKKS